MNSMNPFRILRFTAVLGSYNFGEPVWGENMTRQEAEQTAKDMEGLSVSRDFLGLPLELSFPMHGRYKIVKTYLSDIPNSDRGAGLILADCEGDEPFAQDVLNTLRKDVKDL